MPEEYETKGGQKVTLHYDRSEKLTRQEKKRAFGGSERHTDRRALNRKIRRETFAKSSENTGPVSEKETVFKKVAKHITPEGVAGARAAGEAVRGKGPIAYGAGYAAGAAHQGIKNTGNRVGSLLANQTPPVWLNDVGAGRRKQTSRVKGGGLPPWILGGGMPWEHHEEEPSPVEKIIITRVHADGTKTRSYRKPRERQVPRGSRPGWIQF